MKHVILSVVFLFAVTSLCAQPAVVDSLNKVLITAKQDTNKVYLLQNLSKAKVNAGNLKEALAYANQSLALCDTLMKSDVGKKNPDAVKRAMVWGYQMNAVIYEKAGQYDKSLSNDSMMLVISKEMDYKKGRASANNNKGVVLNNLGRYDEGLEALKSALKDRTELDDKRDLAITITNIGTVHYFQGNLAESLKYYFQALKIKEDMGDTQSAADSYHNIGTIYQAQHNYPEALTYFNKALKIKIDLNDQSGMAAAYINIAVAYQTMNELDSALSNNFRGLKIKQQVGDPVGAAFAQNNIADIYLKQGRYKEALDILFESIKVWEQIGHLPGVAAAELNIGSAYTKLKQYNLAATHLNKALEISTQIKNDDEMKEAYFLLSELSNETGDFKKAHEYYKQYTSIKDTLLNQENNKQIAQYKTQYETEKKDSEIKLLNKDKEVQQKEISRQKIVRNSFIGGFAIVLLFAGVFFTQRNRITKEKKRSDDLLLNILPAETAEELKITGAAKAKDFTEVTVLFTDFKNFTSMSEKLTAQELVNEINYCYSAFDNIVTKYGIEKIKTIGDSYMCAGGLPVANKTNATDAVKAALEIRDFMLKEKQKREREGKTFFEIRIGCNTGPVVAGIVGIKKYSYDIWGDTVNIASRMESSGEPGMVNISGSTYELVKDKFNCAHRGKIEAKNKGMIDMFFVEKILSEQKLSL